MDPARGAAGYNQIISPATCPEEARNTGVLELSAHAIGSTLFVGRAGFAGLDIWDLKTRSLKRHLRWPENGTASVIAISQDSELAAVSDGEIVEIRKLETGARIRALSTQGYAAPTAFSERRWPNARSHENPGR